LITFIDHRHSNCRLPIRTDRLDCSNRPLRLANRQPSTGQS